MKIAIATFVKTPGMSPIKTRLGQSIGAHAALEFYVKSLAATHETIDQIKKDMDITAYWAVAEKQALGAIFWKKWPQIWQGEGGLGERMATIYSELKKDFEVVAFFGADSPHIRSKVLIDGLNIILKKNASTVVGPTEDGGFYFLASTCDVTKSVWTKVEYSQKTTLEQLKNVWPQPMVALESNFDIDTKEELLRLKTIDSRF